jgi:L-serine dehydratase
MPVSVFDVFKIGIGPSSSHTVGPMRAAAMFAAELRDVRQLPQTSAIRAELFGSLGATGRGHGSDRAVILGLMGETPEGVDIESIPAKVAAVRDTGRLNVLHEREVTFRPKEDLHFLRESLPFHPNGMRFTALDAQGAPLRSRIYYSVGGGFVVDEKETGGASAPAGATAPAGPGVPYPFTTAVELLRLCAEHHLSISDVMLANEKTVRTEAEVREGLMRIWGVMQECVQRGIHTPGVLPGLGVKRRAADMHRKLVDSEEAAAGDPLAVMDWVNLFALAVNEENAAGGRVVTAPTNGAAGIIPAVLHYYVRFVPEASDDGVVRFLLTAGAIGTLYKENASISGAEVGCQGEVGSACSMAAGALAEVMGGTAAQAENAAEIGMEHNLGLTCDPIGGLVQIPCIERNAMGSIKAINAARMALQGSGEHYVSLDKVIRTMRDTGRDMKDKYKETSRGGLAIDVVEGPLDVSVNLPEC